MKINFQKLGRFGIAGGIATLISYISFPLIYETIFDRQFFALSFVLASFINVSASYFMQRNFVFKSSKNWLPEYAHFWLNASLLMSVAFLALYSLVHWTQINPFFANFIVVTLSAIASYMVHNTITFGSAK
jgi:putative flippase GtrA